MPTKKKSISPRFALNKEDLNAILRVLGYTVATAVVTALISLTGAVDFPPELLWLAPVINTVLVALKKYLSDNS